MGTTTSKLTKSDSASVASVSYSRLRFDSPNIAASPQHRRGSFIHSRSSGNAAFSPEFGPAGVSNGRTFLSSPKVHRLARPLSLTDLPTEGTPLMAVGTPKLITASVEFPPPTMDIEVPSFGSEGAIAVIESPPLIVWIFPALLCALAYALYNIFIKKSSATTHPVLGGVILQIVAAALGGVLLLFIIFRDGTEKLEFDKSGIEWAILAGGAVGAAEMLSFYVMGIGVPAVQAVPIVIGGSVLFGTLLGAAWLGESLTLRGWAGVLLLVVGIGMVATDPGGEGEEEGKW